MSTLSDDVADPELAAGLLLARHGQAYYARRLDDLADDELDAESLLPGWSRRTLAAHVGLNARALCNLTTWARTGVETPMYSSTEQRERDIEVTSARPVADIRDLNRRAANDLDQQWRDLPRSAWRQQVRTAQGRLVPASETVWMRTREVWLHAVDLRNGGQIEHFPPELHDSLIDDLLRMWRRRAGDAGDNLELRATDRSRTWRLVQDRPAAYTVVGTAAQLVAWGTGRDRHAARAADGRPAPVAPTWL
ncbi:MAG TPA: maleylpyruvate isomerase family mycothiol-dependent enzyme [Nocardioidaceae bacterium]|nr:maleylpyruvate isomerase family mycothiol-dependent enzyme [Nocardioidaceae bacterium]